MVQANPFPPGSRLIDGNELNDALAQPKWQSLSGLTALSGGAQSGATQLQVGTNEVATVAVAADSVQLPPADGSSVVTLVNNGANAVQVFGKSGRTDTINGTAGATGISVANAKTIIFFSFAVGKWASILTA